MSTPRAALVIPVVLCDQLTTYLYAPATTRTLTLLSIPITTEPVQDIGDALAAMGFEFPVARHFAMWRGTPVYQVLVLPPTKDITGMVAVCPLDLPVGTSLQARYMVPMCLDPALRTDRLIWLG